jgi:competence protein ComEC
VSFLDVGQGDATLVQQPGLDVLVDTGPPDGPVLRRLRESRVKRLDALLITHAQSDHEGAALEVIAKHRPRLLLNGGAGWRSRVQQALPAAARRAGARVVALRAGQQVRLGALTLGILWPRPLPTASRHRATRTSARPSRTCRRAASTCSCPPTPSRRSPPGWRCPGSRR